MSITSYQELDIWKLGMSLASSVYQLTRIYPEFERYGLASQTQRAVVSIPSHIAEGWGRGVGQAQVAFLKIARGSVFEVETLLLLATQLGYLTKDEIAPVIEELDRLSRKITNYSIGVQKMIVRDETARYGDESELSVSP